MGRITGCVAAAALLAVLGLGLSACDGGSASTAARDHTASTSSDMTVASNDDHSVLNGRDGDGGYRGGGYGRYDDEQNDPRKEPVALVDGKPMWAANRRHTAEENAQYQFQRDGADFGASSMQDFVSKAHAFTAAPPKGALTLTRSNGDKLIYDPANNIFAVVTKEGAPRTMFKPQSGRAYWDQQVARQDDDSGGQSGHGGGYHRDTHRGGDSSDDQG